MAGADGKRQPPGDQTPSSRPAAKRRREKGTREADGRGLDNADQTRPSRPAAQPARQKSRREGSDRGLGNVALLGNRRGGGKEQALGEVGDWHCDWQLRGHDGTNVHCKHTVQAPRRRRLECWTHLGAQVHEFTCVFDGHVSRVLTLGY